MIIEPYRWHQARILRLDKISPDTITVQVERPDGYTFFAGQYAITRTYVRPDKFLVRQYSFSSAPSAEWLEFTIQKETGGEVTTWLHEHARAGDMMEISQSYGHFTFEHVTRPLLFIAGRVGITPFMSYLRSEKAGDARILYSVETKDQVCFWDEIKDRTTTVVTSEQPRINRELLAGYIEKRPVVYICGSRLFSEAMQSHLADLGVPPSDIKRELFTL